MLWHLLIENISSNIVVYEVNMKQFDLRINIQDIQYILYTLYGKLESKQLRFQINTIHFDFKLLHIFEF